MVVVLKLLWGLLAARFKSRAWLEAENLILRHQLSIAERRRLADRRRVRLGGWDRLLLIGLRRLLPSILDALMVIQPGEACRAFLSMLDCGLVPHSPEHTGGGV